MLACPAEPTPQRTALFAEINNWPDYIDDFAQMNYALREHGWLDEFRSELLRAKQAV